jgi:DNA-directed RNA polymerase alpha subunit
MSLPENIRDRGGLLYREVIEYLHLSCGTTNALLRAGIGTIDALCQQTPKSLREFNGLNKTSISHIRSSLAVRCSRALTDDGAYTPERLKQFSSSIDTYEEKMKY